MRRVKARTFYPSTGKKKNQTPFAEFLLAKGARCVSPKTAVAEPQCRPCGEAALGCRDPLGLEEPGREPGHRPCPPGRCLPAGSCRASASPAGAGAVQSKAVGPRHRCVRAGLVLPQAQHRPQTKISQTRAPWIGALKAPFLFGAVKLRRQDGAQSQLFCPSPTRSPI